MLEDKTRAAQNLRESEERFRSLALRIQGAPREERRPCRAGNS